MGSLRETDIGFTTEKKRPDGFINCRFKRKSFKVRRNMETGGSEWPFRISRSSRNLLDATKIKNYHKEEVDAQCQVEDDKLVLTITGGKAGTVKITRLIKDDKLHVEQEILEKKVSARRVFEKSN